MQKVDLEKLFEQHKDRFIAEWKNLLTFPSIGVDPARRQDCVACAEWLAAHLKSIGFSSRLLATPSNPLVFAEHPGAAGRPVVLFYGHYDVQPVDPLDQWQTPPFVPTLRNGRMYARGAQDNKGQFFSALKAMEILRRQGALGCTVRVLLEGDEESGTMPIIETLEAHRDLIRADAIMAADTATVESGAPTITMGLRGIVSCTAVLSGPSHDLHSGVHGGRIPNPATELARLIATLHRDDGSVAVDGFYDRVRDPGEEERAMANAAGFDADRYARATGVEPVGGERRFTPVERTGFRPALDLNGIHAGYGGPGSKTIIPAAATAKISARLVPDQDPPTILAAIGRHLQRRVPPGLRLEITEANIGGSAIRVSPKSRLVQVARAVLDELSELKTAFLWEGASVPIVSRLPALAGGEPLLVGFGGEEDRIHAPNESFSLDQFRKGFLFNGLFLSRL